MSGPTRIKSITEFHRLRDLPLPSHPLISIADYGKMQYRDDENPLGYLFDHYTISVKRGVGKLYYGQHPYDFDEGVMYCMAPQQLLRVNPEQTSNPSRSGWILMIHPDFLWGSSLAGTIRQYDFFDYRINEALFLSEKEEQTINTIVSHIKQEYQANIDTFSHQIIIAHIETLLRYIERFYHRQFITRKITNHQVLGRLELLLAKAFEDDALAIDGPPSVQVVAEALNLSSGYLSGLLKVLTGQSTQQHIHDKVIQKAKEKLSTTPLSVSEIAFQLGFEHSQSFSKLFKAKTNQSPGEFRNSSLLF